MKQITFNCFKRLALMLLCVFAFTANSFAQDEWVEFISDPLTDNSWNNQWKTYEFEIKDPYYCGFPEAESGKLVAECGGSFPRSEIEGVTGICFPTFENNGNVPNEYFAVKTYLTPGKYKFSYRFKKNSKNPADDLAFFYTKDLNGEKNVVLEKNGINTSSTTTYTTPEFEITESGFYYMGFHGCGNNSYVKTWFLDFRMYRRGGAPEVPTFHKVTLNQTGDGIVQVKNGENVVTLPADVEEGTELTVEAYEMPGFKLTSLTAGGVDIMADKKFTVNDDTEIAVVFSENKYVQEFGQGSGDKGRNWQNVVFTTASDNSKTVNVNYTPNGTYDIYSDELAIEDNKVSVYPGETFEMVINGNLNWIYTLAYIDWNGDGTFDEEPANLENLGFNPVVERDFATNANSRTYKVTVPEDAKIGETRIRVVFGWKQTNLETIPSGEEVKNMNSTSIDEKKNAIARDFLLNIKTLDLPQRTVTVQSANTEMGTAVITGTEDQSITTNKLNVSVTAKPAAGYMFVNWTNADGGAEVSSENPYVYNGSADITLVANFAVKDYPVMKRKFETINQQNRYLKEVVATVGETPQTIFKAASKEDLPVTEYTTANTWTEEGALIGKTETSIVLENGTTSFDMTFKAWTEAFSVNGESCTQQIIWTEQACYIDWNNDKDFDDQGEVYEAVGTAGTNNDFGDENGSLNDGWTRTFSVPAGIKAGTYRMRVVYSQSSNDGWENSFFATGKGELISGISYDFNIEVEEGAEPVYTVTWDGDTAGGSLKVVYASDESKEVINGVTGVPAGTELKVIVTTDPAYNFKSLSYQLGDAEPVTFEDEPYTFTLTKDAVLTAVFEEKIPVLTWEVGGFKNGWGITVITAGDQTVEVPERAEKGELKVAKGTEVSVSTFVGEGGVSQGVVATLLINDKVVALDSEGKYTFTMEKDTKLKVEYDLKKYNVTFTTVGEGTVALKYGGGTSAASQINADTEFEVVATPAQGWILKASTVTIGGESKTGTTFKATGDVVVNTVFEMQKYDLAVEQPEEGATISVKIQGKDEELVPGEGILSYGDVLEITVELDDHYVLNGLMVNGMSQGNETTVYTYTVGEEDVTISADVELEKFALEIEEVEGITIAVRAQDVAGVIKPGKSAVQYGQVLLIGVAVNEGYILKSVSVNGNIIDAVEGKYTHTVDGDVTITAVVEKDTSSIDSVENGTVYYNAAEQVLYTGNAESVKVYDLSGRIVLNADNCERVSLAGLADGIYTAVVDGKVVKLNK